MAAWIGLPRLGMSAPWGRTTSRSRSLFSSVFAAGATAEEDDLLRLEALHDELRDGLDGVSVERVFNDAHGETLA